MTLIGFLLTTTLLLFLLMTATWAWGHTIRNYGIVDAIWSYSFSVAALIALWGAPGWLPRRALIGTIVCLWSVRLGTYLAIRIARSHPEEDARYSALRSRWGTRTLLKMWQFYLFQAAVVVLFAIVFYLIARNPAAAWHWLEWLGLGIWMLAFLGESLADRQLQRFKSNPNNRGKVCREGLWRYSRHPNYFFEWLIWVGFFVMALGSPWGWAGLYAPLLMLFFLLKMTGIPATEARALESKGEAYRHYQESTNEFFPWFPKNNS